MPPRRSALTLAICILAIVTCIDPLPRLLQFDRAHPWQAWRWITCHLTHFSPDHLFWDLLVFAALGLLCERIDRRRFVWTLVTSSLAISLGVAVWQPQLWLYRGLSGIDCALFGLLCGQLLARQKNLRCFAAAIMLLFVIKIGIEITTASAVFVDSSRAGFTPVPLAHAMGAAVGLLCALALARSSIPESRPE